MPCVLIWITCRNYEHFLPEALSSALAQKDSCVGVAHDNCGRDDPVGVAVTRNHVLTAAVGVKYVVFLDADDRLPTGYVSSLLEVANGSDCVVTCNGIVFEGTVKTPVLVATPVTLDSLLRLNTIPVSALVPVSVLLQFGGFDSTLSAYEDWDLWCRLFRNGIEFRYCATTHLEIRRHAQSRHATKTMPLNVMRKILSERYQ